MRMTYQRFAVKQKGTEKYLVTHVSRYGQTTGLSDRYTMLKIDRFESQETAQYYLNEYVNSHKKITKEDLEIVSLHITVEEFSLIKTEEEE